KSCVGLFLGIYFIKEEARVRLSEANLSQRKTPIHSELNSNRLSVLQISTIKVKTSRFLQLEIKNFLGNFASEYQRKSGEGSKMESKEALRARLTPLQYQVTQEAGTERPFTGCYDKHYEKGMYVCIVCRQELFSSNTKYDSGCGWPAFNDVLDKGKITLHKDTSIAGMLITSQLTETACLFIFFN
uniref:peptide-methionine (R)-S-oxide reductase n=1 Tax=Lutzomyia longipalpis TaxID=7200 RepID=A0A1B0CXC5_LUTLO